MLASEDTQVTFDAAAFAGGPLLTYRGPYGTATLQREDVTIEETAVGRLVTGQLGTYPDRGDLWLSLVLPPFSPTTLGDPPMTFETIAILTWKNQHIAGPPRAGALREYEVLSLAGTAELVAS